MLRPSFFCADVAVALILLHLHVAHAVTAAKQPNLGKKRCRVSPPTHGHFHDPCVRFACKPPHGSGTPTPTPSVLALGPAPQRRSSYALPPFRFFALSLSRSLAPSLPHFLVPNSVYPHAQRDPAHSARVTGLQRPLHLTSRTSPPTTRSPRTHRLSLSTADQRVHVPCVVLFLQDDQDEFLGGWTPMKQVRREGGGAECLHRVLYSLYRSCVAMCCSVQCVSRQGGRNLLVPPRTSPPVIPSSPCRPSSHTTMTYTHTHARTPHTHIHVHTGPEADRGGGRHRIQLVHPHTRKETRRRRAQEKKSTDD